MPVIEYENLGRLNQPFFEDYRTAFNSVLSSGWYVLGNAVKNFENAYAAYCQTRHCVGVANGLDALILALKAFNFEPGAEVIVPSNTYIATILAIVHNQLKPILVEPDIHTYNIDPLKIAEKITSKTKAIIVVHLYGKLCDMEAINNIAASNNLQVIEDCAQAHGASFNNRKAGNWGVFGAHSFYPTKNLGGLGDAGALTCNDDILQQKVFTLRNYGSKIKYRNEAVGFNSRLDELQAAFLTVKLAKLDAINAHKRALAAIYHASLKEDFVKPAQHPGYFDVFHIFNIRHPKRDALKEYLLKNGIQTEIHYPIAPNKQTAMAGILDNQPSPIAEEIHQTTLSLPISYFHTASDLMRITEVMNQF
ncbi:MAG: DegT/DnrJ/EryC1/StrS family aminotransferase [Chitinophagaceae bacterium]